MSLQFLDIKDIDNDIAELQNPTHYRGYLHVMAHFSNYSWRNILLIYQQMPNATKLADFNTWKKTYGRSVKQGTTTVKINAPVEQQPIKRLVEKADPTTGEVMLDDSGKRIMEEIFIAQPPKFELVRLFDVSQTKGEPLLILAGNVMGDELLLQAFTDVLTALCQDGTHTDIQNMLKYIAAEGLDIANLDTAAFVLDSIIYVICRRFGIDGDFDPAKLEIINADTLETIVKQSGGIISTIEDKITLLCKERNLDPMTLPKTAEPTPNAEPTAVSTAEPPVQAQTPTAEMPEETPPAQAVILLIQAEHTAQDEPKKPQPLKHPPDPTITIAERNQYGYTRPELLPLNKDRAIALFQRDITVYMLHKNNTEVIAHYLSDLQNHNGIYGVAYGNWQNSREYIALASGNPEDIQESNFIYNDGDSFAIYQIKHGDPLLCFKSYEEIQAKGLDIDRKNYNLIYTAALPIPPSDTPEGIFMWVSAEQLDDYKGRAMAISDVVSIKKDDVITSYYANGRTYKELLDFVGEEGRKPRAAEVVAVVETELQGKQETETPVPAITEPPPQLPQQTLPETQLQPGNETQAQPNTDTQPPPAATSETEPNTSTTEPPDLPKDRASVDVYRLSASEAEKHNAMPAYELSRRIDIDCAKVIDDAIEYNRDKENANQYNMITPAEILLEEYGKNRMLWVLAKHMLANPNKLSKSNLEWADKFVNDETGSGDKVPAFVIKTRHAVLDAFATQLQAVLNEPPSFSDRMRKAKQKSDAHNNASG